MGMESNKRRSWSIENSKSTVPANAREFTQCSQDYEDF